MAEPTDAEKGYNLVALMVLVAVMSIGLAAALPSISQAVRREREAELIFRGLQYAEAIRVFQQRTGRYPVSLRELLHNNPRSIRQLWLDPFNDKGEWGLIVATGAVGGRPVAAGGVPGQVGEIGAEDEDSPGPDRRRRQPLPTENVLDPDRRETPRSGQVVSQGPIVGVRSLISEDSVRTFMGSNTYSEWLFMVDLLPTVTPEVVGENVPRLHSNWVGKAFPEGLQSGMMPGAGAPAADNPLDRENRRRRKERSPSRRRRSRG